MTQKIKLTDTMEEIITKLASGNPGALRVVMDILKNDEYGLFLLFGLDDMAIKGPAIWVGYKDYCKQDIQKFIDCIQTRDKGMVDCILKEGYHAQTHGASWEKDND